MFDKKDSPHETLMARKTSGKKAAFFLRCLNYTISEFSLKVFSRNFKYPLAGKIFRAQTQSALKKVGDALVTFAAETLLECRKASE